MVLATLCEGSGEMGTLKEQLIEKGLSGTKKTKSSTENRDLDTKSNKSVRKERLSEWELAELMGTNRPTYGRKKGGAYRQR